MPELRLIHARVGSHAYGTNLPDSDLDLMSIYVGDPYVYLGMDYFGQQGTRQYKQAPTDGIETEITHYEVLKFMRMLTSFNPNVIPILYLDEYIEVHPLGQEIIDNRKMFNSRAAYHSFSGMAHNQIKKMVDGDTTGEMGAKRKAIRDEHGFDRKHALHAIRLQRTLLEFIRSDGEVMNINRTNIDREELMAIRLGPIPLIEIQQISNDLEQKINKAIGKSSLPPYPDRDKINEFCVNLLKRAIL